MKNIVNVLCTLVVGALIGASIYHGVVAVAHGQTVDITRRMPPDEQFSLLITTNDVDEKRHLVELRPGGCIVGPMRFLGDTGQVVFEVKAAEEHPHGCVRAVLKATPSLLIARPAAPN